MDPYPGATGAAIGPIMDPNPGAEVGWSCQVSKPQPAVLPPPIVLTFIELIAFDFTIPGVSEQ